MLVVVINLSNAAFNDTGPVTTMNMPTLMVTETEVMIMDSTTGSTSPETTENPAEVLWPVGVMMMTLLIIVATVVALVYYKRKRSSLVNLTKPHKGSEENSYVSSEHSHQQGSKYSESPEPGYDVIKPMHKAKIFPSKSSSLDTNPRQLSEYASIEDNKCDLLHYSGISSSCDYSAPSTKNNSSINFQKCGEMKQEVFLVDSEIEKAKDKQKQLTEDAANANNSSTKGEASPIPPQTIEMMYTAVQKKLKVNSEIDSEFEDNTPPPPPQTTEMMYTAVQKRPKDNILAEVEDDAPPVPPYMEKKDKETEATAKGSDEGSPPPVPP